ncbi:MAG: ABC transporter ATP-binding protein [Clostridia bacterium]
MSRDVKTDVKPKGPMGGHGPMGGGHGPMGGEKPKDFKGTFKKLAKYLSAFKLSIFVVVVFAIASTVFTIVGPKILGGATTELFRGIMGTITGKDSGIDFTVISTILIELIGLYFLSSLFSYIQGYIMTGVSMKVTYNLRGEISQKINKLPLKFFDNRNYGEVLSLITNDVDVISQTLNQSISQIITSIAAIIGIAYMMFTISISMTVLSILILPLSLLLIAGIVKKSQKYYQAQQEYIGHVNGHIEEMYGNHNLVTAFNGQEKSIEEFDRYSNTLYKNGWKSNFASGLMMPIVNFAGNIGYVGICILGGYLAVTRGLPVGDIQAFIQYVRQFTQPIAQVANISNILQQTVAASERVFGFLEEEEEVEDSKTPTDVKKLNGNVTFENVSFGYNPDKIIVNNFSATVKDGQKIAIVGPTGAGKTTMVKLLMRFYDVTSGKILVDGIDIKDFTREDLRSMFGMVLQDTWLYNTTICENIRYGNLECSDEEVHAAAKAAQVDHFVRTLPDSYNMVLNEEASNVSQGQKQLLTIARAILADPKILILDEATSSVDTRTEVLIQKAMDNLMKGRTSFVIAHRLSTIKNADLILVMNNGDIVEQGTHDALIAKQGFYANLYNSQFEKPE